MTITEAPPPVVRTTTAQIAPLALAQVVGWGILYYATIVAASRIAADTGWSLTVVTSLFSGGLIVSAVAGIWVGRLLDAQGPRLVMTAGSALGAAGFALVALAPNPITFGAAWVVVGTAQAAVLYQAVFTVITRRYGPRRHVPLTIITVAGGLASTVFAPITAGLLAVMGWRQAFGVLAVTLAVVTVPVHWFCLEPRWAAPSPHHPQQHHTIAGVLRSRRFWFLQTATVAIVVPLFAVTLTAIPLYEEKHLSFELAALALGLIGAGQIVGRLLLLLLPRGLSPWKPLAVVGVVTATFLGFLAAVPGPAWVLVVAGVLTGAARGAQTLVQASAVADRWGTASYGAINGVFAAPVTIVAALAPAIGPAVAAAVGSYAGMAALMAGVALVGAVLARGS
ncbi:MAG: MFS transporter [Micrococcales bacterium]|nr:MFS transporter [Micrococcales bacterium]